MLVFGLFFYLYKGAFVLVLLTRLMPHNQSDSHQSGCNRANDGTVLSVKMPLAHQQSGFSLIELLVVLVIMAIISAIAMPSLTSSIEKQRNKQVTETVVAAFREARTESQIRRQDVTVKAAGSALQLLVVETRNKRNIQVPIKNFSVNKNTSIRADTAEVVFKSNKTVTPKKGDKTQFTYTVLCNKYQKQGSTVTVDANGNVQVDNKGNQC